MHWIHLRKWLLKSRKFGRRFIRNYTKIQQCDYIFLSRHSGLLISATHSISIYLHREGAINLAENSFVRIGFGINSPSFLHLFVLCRSCVNNFSASKHFGTPAASPPSSYRFSFKIGWAHEEKHERRQSPACRSVVFCVSVFLVYHISSSLG